jgi:hypothetical protein
VQVRDFEILKDIYKNNVDHTNLSHEIEYLGNNLKIKLGFDWPTLTPQQSRYTLELYEEAINLGLTYYRQ